MKKIISCDINYSGSQLPIYAMMELDEKDFDYLVEKAYETGGVVFLEDLHRPVDQLRLYTSFWKYDKKGNPVMPDERIIIMPKADFLSLLDDDIREIFEEE